MINIDLEYNKKKNQEELLVNEILQILEKLEIIPFCCYCKESIKINNDWYKIPKETGEKINKMDNVSHGCCLVCALEVKKQIQKYIKNKGNFDF